MIATLFVSLLAPAELPREFAPWTIAYVQQGDIFISNGEGRYQRRVAKDGTMPTWLPNKRRLAFARGRQVWVVDRDGKNQRCIYKSKLKDGGLWGISWAAGLAPGRVWEVGQLEKETPKESILIADEQQVFNVGVQGTSYAAAEGLEPIYTPT